MNSFSEVVSMNTTAINSFNNTEITNMSGSRRTSVRRSTIRKWLKACKNVLRKTFKFKCTAADVSFIEDPHLHIPIIVETEALKKQFLQTQSTKNSTTESNISFNTLECDIKFDYCPQDGREIKPLKMFASLDVNLLALARQNLKSTNFQVCRGHVQEKILLYEKRIAGLDQENCRKNEKLITREERVHNLRDRVRFFEDFSKISSPNVQKVKTSRSSNKWNSEEDEIHIVLEDIFVPVKVAQTLDIVEPTTNCENLTDQDKTIVVLIEELHKQCYFMKQANNLIEACLKVKAFELGKVHLHAEKLLLLAYLRRDMLLKRIRKMQFPEETQTSLKSGVIRAEISNLKFIIPKEHKDKKSSFIIICSNETDMHVSHIIKAKSEKESISIPEAYFFKNFDEDCRINIKVYQLNYGNHISERVLQLMNEKHTKSRRRISIQYKNAYSGFAVEEQILEPLYKVHSSLKIDFTNIRNVAINPSNECSLQGLLTLELFEGKSTFTF